MEDIRMKFNIGKNRVAGWLRKFKMFLTRSYMRGYAVIHPIKKKIVFMSFGGRQYSDNPRAISEKLHEIFPEYELVWIMNQEDDSYGVIPDYVRTVKSGGLSKYKEIASAFCYITNTNNEPDIAKRKGQFFVQTWHGDGGFKKILYANNQGRTNYVPTIDNLITDVCMAGSSYGEQKYKSAFKYNNEILVLGCARNDKLIRQNTVDVYSVKKRLSLDEEYKILLYAPTFRKKGRNQQKVEVDLEEVLQHLSKKYQGKWICLLRAHPSACFKYDNMDDKKIMNVSDYPDMADLLLIADFLITDYSSSSLDFALTRRGMVLTTFDLDEYMENERELAVNPEDTGFILAKDQRELMKIIDTYSAEDYRKSCDKVLEFYGSKETGEAALRICERIDEAFQLYSSQ